MGLRAVAALELEGCRIAQERKKQFEAEEAAANAAAAAQEGGDETELPPEIGPTDAMDTEPASDETPKPESDGSTSCSTKGLA